MEKAWYKLSGRPVALHIDLDALTNNVAVLRSLCTNKKTAIVAMVKANAYGHGSTELSLHLQAIGVERFGVASLHEGIELRQAGITRPIHVMGNTMEWEMLTCLEYNLIPTISTTAGVKGMAKALQDYTTQNHKRENIQTPCGTIHIKIDTGMSRNGCQPADLDTLVQMCDEFTIPIEGMFTHLADYENTTFTEKQVESFLHSIQPYRSRGLLFHLSNSGAIINNIATDLDMVRPGISLYGLPPGTELDTMKRLGFRPIGTVCGTPTFVKCLPPGRKIGYGCTYETELKQWIATIPLGYGDGYFRSLSNKGMAIRDKTGERCPVVGRVSMDAITIRLSEKPADEESFTLISADYDPVTSASGIAMQLDTISYEITTRLMPRLPSIYTKDGKPHSIKKLAGAK